MDMNSLLSQLSGVYTNTNTNNSQNLLTNQQVTTDKINALIEEAAESIVCGPACQKIKKENTLNKNLVNAKTNMESAPYNLEKAKKEYVVFKNGESYYNDMLEEELKQKAEIIGDNITEKFNEEVNNAKIMNTYYNSDCINSSHTEELHDEYVKKVKHLEKEIKVSYGDILTNDRKTYYETEALDGLKNWYTFFWYCYYLIAFIFILLTFFSPNDMSIIKKIVFTIFIIIYPYLTYPVLHYIYNSSMRIYYILFPKNVYKTI